MKTLKELSWNVTEEEYRKDSAYSYSTISRFRREGFNKLDSLFEKIDTPSLLFGSMVDCLITEGIDTFMELYGVTGIEMPSEKIIKIVQDIFDNVKDKEEDIELGMIDDATILDSINKFYYYPNWKDETRIKVVKKEGSQYFSLLNYNRDKILVPNSLYTEAMNAVRALKTSENTKKYFDDIEKDGIEKYYQLKWKATLNGIDYRCMMDLVIVNHNDKTIIPIDLKTSSKPEWDFYKSFLEYRYDIQNRLYYRILKENLKDTEYKDYNIVDYIDVVINKETLTPLVWVTPFTKIKGNVKLNEKIILEDPEDIAKELDYYLKNRPKVPTNIKINEVNNIEEFLKNYKV